MEQFGIRKKKLHKAGKRIKKVKRSSGLFIAPSFLGVLLFFVIPFLVVIFYSLVDNPNTKNFVGLSNFQYILGIPCFADQSASVKPSSTGFPSGPVRIFLTWSSASSKSLPQL